MTRRTADAILLELGSRMGLPGLRMDESGCCQLVFDRRWLVSCVVHPTGERMMLHCPISAPDALDTFDTDLLTVLLRGNFMGCSACGGSLAVTPDRRVCVQYELFLPATSVDGLQQAIERVLQAAQTWSTRLACGPAPLPGRRASGPHLMSLRA